MIKNSIKQAAITVFAMSSLSSLQAMNHPPIEIHEIEINGSVQLNNKGYFANLQSVENFIKRASIYTMCPDPEVTSMCEEAEIGQFGTTVQLFCITCSDGRSYILKEIKDTDKAPARNEIERLELVHRSPRLAPYIHPEMQGNLQLIVPVMYLSYTYEEKLHILALMSKAQGISLQDLMQAFKRQPDDNSIQALHCKAYYDLGTALALFYKTHGTLDKTVTHGDLHAGNIFYDEDTGLVTLIDNERIVQGGIVSQSNVGCDLGKLFVVSPCVVMWAQPDFFNDFEAKKWYSLIVPSFVLGFLATFSKEDRIPIFLHLKSLLKKWVTYLATKVAREGALIKPKEFKLFRALIEEQFKTLKTQLIIEDGALTALVKQHFGEKTQAIEHLDKAM